MNWFAVAVTVLQTLASLWYLAKGQYSDSAIWFLYCIINVILIWKASQ